MASERKQFMSSKITNIRPNVTPTLKAEQYYDLNRPRRFNKNYEENKKEFDFRWVSKQVEELGASKFKGKQKRDYEEAKILAMGGKVKKEKVPLKMLQGMKKKQKEREEKQIQEQKDHGIHVKKNAEPVNLFEILQQGQQSKPKKPRFHKPQNRGLKGSIGRFRDGVLKISQEDIARVESSAHKRKRSFGGSSGGGSKGKGGGGSKGKGGGGRPNKKQRN